MIERSPARQRSPERTRLSFLSELAGLIDLRRCNHAAQTGLATFSREIRDELESVIQTQDPA